ncbi:hypothetical protein [Aneurinibacillus tyrosinisolvens]|uniref:hypothetical protein n=1 Tax=Aneurinibacillus tyrosinisolvens TaxID=1443435 RepID=UPI00063F9BC1|nr:hypothetical protein [Aneurinibacillus tyrosinisolvens]
MKHKMMTSLLSACLLLSPTMAMAAEQKTEMTKPIQLASLSKSTIVNQLQKNVVKVQSVKSMRANGQFSVTLDAPTTSTGLFSTAFSKIKGAVNNTKGTFQTAFQAPGNMYTKVAVNYSNGKQIKEPVSIENYYMNNKQYIKLPLVPGKYSWVQKQAGNNVVVESLRNSPMFLQPNLLKTLSLVYKGNGEFTYSGAISSVDAIKMLESVGVPKDILSVFKTVSGSIVLNGKLTIDPKTFLTKGTNFTISLVPKDSRYFKKLSVNQNLSVSGYNATTITLPAEAAAAKAIPLPPLPF